MSNVIVIINKRTTHEVTKATKAKKPRTTGSNSRQTIPDAISATLTAGISKPNFWNIIIIISINQSINQSFILTRYVKELKTRSKYERV